MDLLIIAVYLIPTVLLLNNYESEQEKVLEKLPVVFPAQIMLIRAWVYILAVFWPVMLFAGLTFMKQED